MDFRKLRHCRWGDVKKVVSGVWSEEWSNFNEYTDVEEGSASV